MNILIFDDNENDINHLYRLIKDFFKSKNIECNIDINQDIDFLYKNIEYYDLLFLDIQLKNNNGIDIGLKLRERKIQCKIIITTNYVRYAIDGYKIDAERYFTKPIKKEVFDIEMDSVLKKYLLKYDGVLDFKICDFKIYYKDILYIESINRKTKIHLQNNISYTTPYSLKHWLIQLNDIIFGQPYKSFIINYNYVSALKKQDVILFNNESIPLSRHYKKSFEKGYLFYLNYFF